MKQKSEKIGKYGKYVKDMFQPKASLKKKHELTELNKRLQTIPRQTKSPDKDFKIPSFKVPKRERFGSLPDGTEIKEAKRRAGNDSAEGADKRSRNTADHNSLKGSYNGTGTGDRKKLTHRLSHNNSPHQNPKTIPKKPPEDYLAKRRAMRAEQEKNQPKKNILGAQQIDKVINNKKLTGLQKLEQAKQTITNIEDKAQKHEQLLKAKNTGIENEQVI